MKMIVRLAPMVLVCAMSAQARVPAGAFKPSEYAEALAEAKESGKPIAIVTTDTASSCPKCQAGNEEVFKRMRSGYVMVVEDAADKGEELAMEVKQKTFEIYNTKGNTIPIVAVLSEDGERLLGGLCYKQISADGRGAFRTLDKEVEEAKAAQPAPAAPQKPATGEPRPETVEVCETGELREWTNIDGQKIRAKALAVTELSVTFELENGRVLDYPLSKLSEDSREEAKEACK